MLNQLKLILVELFRIWSRWYQPMQLYLWAGFSSPLKPSFSCFAWVTAWTQARAIAHEACQDLYMTNFIPGWNNYYPAKLKFHLTLSLFSIWKTNYDCIHKLNISSPASWPQVKTFIPAWNIIFLHITVTLVSS